MTPEQAKALRAPFPPEAIGKLPKPYKKDSPKGKCAECGGYHGLPAVHLDYVGHAATTDRLLEVDPEWSWRPMCVGPNGEPLIVNNGLWILLTVAGVTRPGWGDGASVKEMIGDAIRNAAMRFGVALDLWAKEDLPGAHDEQAGGSAAVPLAAESSGPAASVTGDSDGGTPAPEPSPFRPPASAGERKPTEAMVKKLNVLYGKLTSDSLQPEKYRMSKAQIVAAAGGNPEDGWAETRDALSFMAAKELLDKMQRRLERAEAALAAEQKETAA